MIDFFGIGRDECLARFPSLYQHVQNTVLPERLKCQRKGHRENWWLFGEKRPAMRTALAELTRYIVTSEVAKHRVFTFLPFPDTLPDGSLAVVASDDAYTLGILSSRVHVVFALAAGGRMGVGNDPRYQNGPCFEPYPFPASSTESIERVRRIAEQLDAHRKRQQELHPDLTMTGMYNVLEKLRSGEPLSRKEQTIHEQGLVSVLKQIHDDLDAAVFDAYGWPHDLTDEQILERLVALNHERAEEESCGLIRWLRPDFQNPAGTTQKQLASSTPDAAEPDDGEEQTSQRPGRSTGKGAQPKKQPWPKTLPERIRALRAALAAHNAPASPDVLAQQFTRAKKSDVAELLDTLVEVGQARVTQDGRYVA
ncbi:MAG: hypothetical protein ACK5Q5_00705 [Planctomycetaceae bacterium]